VQVTIWGCRGSVPTPGPETVEYGGNTSCVEVALDDGTVLIFDAGTGIRGLGAELAKRGTRHIHLLLTHLHLDHLEGLRFFAPLWDEGVQVDLWGPPSTVLSLQARIARSFSPPLFPIDLRNVPAELLFHDVPRQPWVIGGATLTAHFVVHPGPTVAYRVDAVEASLAYVPDHEPALTGIEGRSTDWISGAAIATDADMLLHDGQYTEEEYGDRVGWGHSSVADAVAFSQVVGARRLVLFHHEPLHADESMSGLEDRARSLAGPDELQVTLAREGMVLQLP
jgi:phosphoribosyl 1,2-cyclic phosphodiesterase